MLKLECVSIVLSLRLYFNPYFPSSKIANPKMDLLSHAGFGTQQLATRRLLCKAMVAM
jgi:hypothetical protein